MSKPTLPRLLKNFWFFIRCLGVICLPWLFLWLVGWPHMPVVSYLWMAIPISVWFTFFNWLGFAYPVLATTRISFLQSGVSQFHGKQTFNWKYQNLFGWDVIKPQYGGRALLILLLRSRTHKGQPYVVALALPDADTRDQAVKLLGEKQVPHAPDLTPPWETP